MSLQGRPLFLQSSRNVSVNIVNSNNQLLTQLVTGKTQQEKHKLLSCSILMFSFFMIRLFIFQKHQTWQRWWHQLQHIHNMSNCQWKGFFFHLWQISYFFMLYYHLEHTVYIVLIMMRLCMVIGILLFSVSFEAWQGKTIQHFTFRPKIYIVSMVKSCL